MLMFCTKERRLAKEISQGDEGDVSAPSGGPCHDAARLRILSLCVDTRWMQIGIPVAAAAELTLH